ncbi:MAG: hypothetical protein F6K14_06005 [Symploca sp. SIO2C1]|nr:hypothetical protein [Symploca sp. SIO2C1]
MRDRKSCRLGFVPDVVGELFLHIQKPDSAVTQPKGNFRVCDRPVSIKSLKLLSYNCEPQYNHQTYLTLSSDFSD